MPCERPECSEWNEVEVKRSGTTGMERKAERSGVTGLLLEQKMRGGVYGAERNAHCHSAEKERKKLHGTVQKS